MIILMKMLWDTVKIFTIRYYHYLVIIFFNLESGKKVDKSFVLDSQYVCVCNVTKEAIIIVIVN